MFEQKGYKPNGMRKKQEVGETTVRGEKGTKRGSIGILGGTKRKGDHETEKSAVSAIPDKGFLRLGQLARLVVIFHYDISMFAEKGHVSLKAGARSLGREAKPR